MDKPYFVILHCQRGAVAPMVDENDELAMYESTEAACVAARNNPLGAHYGFEVHEVGAGECF